ncbi:MAG: hypothetical protein A2516_10445 [Alphaproteobacteria bacterium RIFOXYD12_FULL_60_8]|nr:MAG: hypothetical protein A2516_10445 [Alphaproteobacteria bacterium RIFOXYD12_FULL_60_8]
MKGRGILKFLAVLGVLLLPGPTALGQDRSGFDYLLAQGECDRLAGILNKVDHAPPEVSALLIDTAVCFARAGKPDRIDALVHESLRWNMDNKFIRMYALMTLILEHRWDAYHRERTAFLSYLRQAGDAKVGLMLRHQARVEGVKVFTNQPVVDVQAFEYHGDFKSETERRLYYFHLQTPAGANLGDILLTNRTPKSSGNGTDAQVFYWVDYVGDEALLDLQAAKLPSFSGAGADFQGTVARFIGTEQRSPSFNAAFNVVLNFLSGDRAFQGSRRWGPAFTQ